MNRIIHIKIITPERTVYEDEIYQATLPMVDGQIAILPDHIPYITELKAGEIMLKKERKRFIWQLPAGL